MWICFLIFFCYRGGTWFYGNHSPLGHITLVIIHHVILRIFWRLSTRDTKIDTSLCYTTWFSFLKWVCMSRKIYSLSFFFPQCIHFIFLLFNLYINVKKEYHCIWDKEQNSFLLFFSLFQKGSMFHYIVVQWLRQETPPVYTKQRLHWL